MTEKSFRDDLKHPDEFVSSFGRLLAIAATHRREVYGLLIVLVLLAGGVFAWQLQKDRHDRAAAIVFQKALDQMPKEEVGANWPVFEAALAGFLKEHGSSSLAPTAHLYHGRAFMRMSKYTDALEAYRKAASGLSGPYRYLAKEGEGMADMQLQKWSDAENIFLELSKAEDNPLKALHTWNLGLAQEAGTRSSQALATYEKFEKDFADSPLLEKVRVRLAALKTPVASK